MTKFERPSVPSPTDAELAAQASIQLLRARHDGAELRVQVDDETLRLPAAVGDLLYRLLTEMAKGNAVAIVPVDAELTTQEAADFLHVSRPHLVRLLEEGKVPFTKVGTHRRVRFSDLATFRRKREEDRSRAMEELAAQAQELGMGY